MKNKETIIGWVLIAALMVGFFNYQNRKFTEGQKKKDEIALIAKEDSIKLAKNQVPPPAAVAGSTQQATDSLPPVAGVTEQVTDSNALNQQFGAFGSAANGEEKTFVIENDLQKITLSSKGGQIKHVLLKKYKTSDGKPLVLFSDKSNSLSYQFFIDNNRTVDTKDFYFEPVGDEFTVTGDASKSFSLRLNAGEGKYFEQKYTLKGNSYLLNYDVNLVGLNTVIPTNSTYIETRWLNTLQSVEKNIELERRYSALYFRYNNSNVDHLNEDNETDEKDIDAPLEWISFKQQFFNATLFSKGEFNKGKMKSRYTKDDHSYVKKYDAKFTLPYKNEAKTTYAFQYYIGPNHFNTLAGLDKETESIIKLGPDFWMFSWITYITRFIIWVFSWFDSGHLTYGTCILLMTLIP